MPKTDNAQRLENLVREIGSTVLESRGFRRAGSTFRREAESGFVHLIDFGLGQSWSMYAGQFTVDMCVFVDEAFQLFFSTPTPRRLAATHCELRMRLGMLRSPPADQWWHVSNTASVAEVGCQLRDVGLPFLARIASRRALVDAWLAAGSQPLGLPPRGDLVAAAMLVRLGDRAGAKKVLSSALERAAGQRYEPFYTQIAQKIRAQEPDVVPAA